MKTRKMEEDMPISERNGKWYWGSTGPFDSRKKAEEVAQAAHASGYLNKLLEFTKACFRYFSKNYGF